MKIIRVGVDRSEFNIHVVDMDDHSIMVINLFFFAFGIVYKIKDL